MLAKVHSAALLGIEPYCMEIEVDVADGLPGIVMVGLPDIAVRESRDRMKAAIKNSGFEYPASKLTVNFAPADIRKEGPSFDLAVALGVLSATSQIKSENLEKFCILGELSLDGRVKPVRGALPIACGIYKKKFSGLILPELNAAEAAIAEPVSIFGVKTLKEAVEFLSGDLELKPAVSNIEEFLRQRVENGLDFCDVKGQEHAKRALEVAAAGGHNIVMIGPPGSGKTMLARRLPSIIPDLSIEEALESTKIYSCVGLLKKRNPVIATRPFRSPHHTISDAGMVGGGQVPRPGEISLSHNGVLFLDELPEFRRDVLEVLRQPLEDGEVTISRAARSCCFPARFMLAAALNPCPCGFFSDPQKECHCTPPQIQRYMSKISGPLLDRIDIHIEVPAVRYRELTSEGSGEPSQKIKSRVNRARQVQRDRFLGSCIGNGHVHCNAQMSSKMIKRFCVPDGSGSELLKTAMTELGMSARAYDKVLKISRTIADLADSDAILPEHISEAIQYRCLDRPSNGIL